MTVIVAVAVLVGAVTLAAVTVTVVFCVTSGAVKFPLASTVFAVALHPAVVTVQVTSEAPRESVAVSGTVWLEKTIPLFGGTLR
jgi:hypothetical protein